MSEASIKPAEGWDRLVEALKEKPGISILIGEVDTGKSCLCAYLARRLSEEGFRVAVVDADVGQSDIGPPTTIGLGEAHPQMGLLSDCKPLALHFVGSPSPEGFLLPTLVGTVRLAQEAQRRGYEQILVDTTGLVHGAGRQLKLSKAQALMPQHIIALERGDELSTLKSWLSTACKAQIHSLKVAPYVRQRTREERRERRKALLSAYFDGAREVVFDGDKVALRGTSFGLGRPLPGHLSAYLEEVLGAEVKYAERDGAEIRAVIGGAEVAAPRGLDSSILGAERIRLAHPWRWQNLAVGLSEAGGFCLGIGILLEADFGAKSFKVLVPQGVEPEKVEVLELGAVRIKSDGTELGRIHPADL